MAAFTSALVCLVAGCGGATETAPETPPPRPPSPSAWLPADSFLVAHVNVTRLRESPYAGTVANWYETWIQENTELDAEARRALKVFEAVWQRTRSVHLGVAGSGLKAPGSEPPEVVAVMRGHYGRGAMKRWIREIPDTGERLKVASRDGHRTLKLDMMHAVKVDASTWAFTLGSHFPRLMQRLREPSEGLQSAALRRLQRDLALHHGALGLVLEPVPEIRAELLDELRGETGDADTDAVAALHALGLRIDVSDGLQVRTVATMENAASAHRLRKRADSLSREYRDNAFVILAGLDLLLNETRTRVSGRQAVAVLDLDHARMHALLFHWDRLARGVAALILGDAEDGGLLKGLASGLGDGDEGRGQKPSRIERKHDVQPTQPAPLPDAGPQEPTP